MSILVKLFGFFSIILFVLWVVEVNCSSKLKASLKDHERVRKALEGVNQARQKLVNELKHLNQLLKDKVSRLETEKQELLDENGPKFLNAFNEIKAKHLQEVKDLKKEIDLLRTSLGNVMNEKETVAGYTKDLQQNIHDLNVKMTSKQEMIRSYEDQLKKEHEKNRIQSEMIQNYERIEQNLENENLNLKSRETALIDGARHLQAEVEDLKRELATHDQHHKDLAEYFWNHPKIGNHLDKMTRPNQYPDSLDFPCET